MKQETFITFEITSPNPIDDRFTLPNLTNLHPIGRRYPGLIFYVISENGPYIYLSDLDNPVPLNTVITGSNQFGLIYNEISFSQLYNELNSLTVGIGGIITVFPLGVTFIKTPDGFKYFSGIYSLTQNQWDTLSDDLKYVNQKVSIDNENFIITSNLELSTVIIISNIIPITPENERYYNIGGILYYCIDGNLWKLGSNVFLLSNVTLDVDTTEIIHNLNSTYINCYIWINNKKINNVDFDTIDENKINILSKMLINNATILIQTL